MQISGIHRYPVKSMRGEALARAGVEPQGLAGDRRYMVIDAQGRFTTAREVPALLTIVALPSAMGLILSHPARGSIEVREPDATAKRAMVLVWRDEVPARLADEGVNTWLSDVLGRDVRLAFLADVTARPVDRAYGAADDVVSFADGFPLLLVSSASLDDLNARIAERRMDAGDPLVMERFRPNVVVGGTVAWSEDTWRVVRIGEVRFRIVKPCARCILTTRDPVTGAVTPDNEPLRTLGAFHRGAGGGIMFGQNLIPIDVGNISVGDRIEVFDCGPPNLG